MKKSLHIEFKGAIEFISCSNQGRVAGIVLDDGTFIKVPPYSIQKEKLLKVGAKVLGQGKLIREEPNRIFKHATVRIGKNVLADDWVEKKTREHLKKTYKKEIAKSDSPAADKIKAKGTVAAVETNHTGHIKQLIFKDGTSVRLSHKIKLHPHQVEIGDDFEVEGDIRSFDKLKFIKAKHIFPFVS